MKKETQSEFSVSEINSTHFFKEFTFNKNEFVIDKNELELSDNIVWIGDLMFFIEIKERNNQNSTENNDKWFLNKVLKKAKTQIKNTHKYLNEHKCIPIINKRNQKIEISLKDNSIIHNIILYLCELDLENKNRNLKFTKSKIQGFIHIFEIKIYNFLCDKLITPSELSDYLNFRAKFIEYYIQNIDLYSEYYILSHFINNENIKEINFDYLSNLDNINNDKSDYDFKDYLHIFYERLVLIEKENNNEYHKIITEIAKLKRYELSEFLLRFKKSINHCKNDEQILPYQFVNENHNCGFVFLPIQKKDIPKWKIMARNAGEIFKYRHKLNKCISIVFYKEVNSFMIIWMFNENKWIFDEVLETINKKMSLMLGPPELKKLKRYNTE